MNLQPHPTTLDELGQLDPNLEKALRGTSRHFFEPRCPNTYVEVGRKPFHNATLQFVPNQPVSRAWDLVFRVMLTRAVNQEFGSYGHLAFDISPQADPAQLIVELDGPVTEDTKRFTVALNYACAAANAVVPDAAEQSRRDHEQLARELGLARPQVGFA